MYVVCFPHTHALHSPYSHILSLFIDLLELLSTWIRALNIFCSPNHCESRGHFHLGLRRLWPQDFQRLSEVQRPNTSSLAALVCLEVPRPLWDRQVLEAGQQPRNHIEAAVGGAKVKRESNFTSTAKERRKPFLYFGGKCMISYKMCLSTFFLMKSFRWWQMSTPVVCWPAASAPPADHSSTLVLIQGNGCRMRAARAWRMRAF